MKYLFLLLVCASIISVASDPKTQGKTLSKKGSTTSLPAVIIHVSAPAKKTQTLSRSTLVRASLPIVSSRQSPAATSKSNEVFNKSLRATNLPSLVQHIASPKKDSEDIDWDAARAFVAREVEEMRKIPAILAAANAYTQSDPVLGTLIRYHAVDKNGRVMDSRGNFADLRKKDQILFVISSKGLMQIQASQLKDITAEVEQQIAARKQELSDDCVTNLE